MSARDRNAWMLILTGLIVAALAWLTVGCRAEVPPCKAPAPVAVERVTVRCDSCAATWTVDPREVSCVASFVCRRCGARLTPTDVFRGVLYTREVPCVAPLGERSLPQ